MSCPYILSFMCPMPCALSHSIENTAKKNVTRRRGDKEKEWAMDAKEGQVVNLPLSPFPLACTERSRSVPVSVTKETKPHLREPCPVPI
jgi:hypothetical protein